MLHPENSHCAVTVSVTEPIIHPPPHRSTTKAIHQPESGPAGNHRRRRPTGGLFPGCWPAPTTRLASGPRHWRSIMASAGTTGDTERQTAPLVTRQFRSEPGHAKQFRTDPTRSSSARARLSEAAMQARRQGFLIGRPGL